MGVEFTMGSKINLRLLATSFHFRIKINKWGEIMQAHPTSEICYTQMTMIAGAAKHCYFICSMNIFYMEQFFKEMN